MRNSLLVVALALLSHGAHPSAAPGTASAEHSARRIAAHGGRQAWIEVPATGAFTQREPNDGAAPTFPTEARIAYDDAALLVSVDATDPEPDRLVGLLTRRDVKSASDWITVAVDAAYDRRTAFEFSVNPRGVKADAYLFADGRGTDVSWDGVWDVAVTRHPGGWRADFRIPFSQLRLREGGGGAIGVAVTRVIARLNETVTWPHLSRKASGHASQFATVRGVQIPGAARRFEVMPYVVSSLTGEPDGGTNPLVESPRGGGAVGVDARIALTAGAMATATINPDFGQVEADPAVVNLTAFETLFAERRPFFVEGSGTFRFDANCADEACTSNLFYSRRIGRAPQRSLAAPPGGFATAPTQTTVLGAVKVAGRAHGFAFGLLNATTAEESGAISSGGTVSNAVVEPLTNFLVARARREARDGSALGVMATAVNRRLVDGVHFLPDAAYATGIDWDRRIGRSFTLAGYVIGSSVRGDAPAIDRLQRSTVHAFQRPDADEDRYDADRTSLGGHAGLLSLARIAGGRLRYSASAGYRSPGFEINDLGFLRRADQIGQRTSVELRWDNPSRWRRSVRLPVSQSTSWNFDGDHMGTSVQVSPYATFANNMSAGFFVSASSSGIDDRTTRGGRAFRTNQRVSSGWYVAGDPRRRFLPNLNGSYGDDWRGTAYHAINGSVTWRPSAAASVSGGWRYFRSRDESAWVGRVVSGGSHDVFGRLEQTTIAFTGRVNYTLTPTLSLETYVEPFFSSGDYRQFKELTDARATAYADRYAPFPYTGNVDFTVRSLRSTTVARWEYRPGSSLFVIWQHGRDAGERVADFALRRNWSELFGSPARNILLVKASYWMNF